MYSWRSSTDISEILLKDSCVEVLKSKSYTHSRMMGTGIIQTYHKMITHTISWLYTRLVNGVKWGKSTRNREVIHGYPHYYYYYYI